MPQLSPLNWIFLFVTFWFIVGIMSTIVWWYTKTSFLVQSTSSESGSKVNKWNW